jgi:succinyl-CoA synthetase beta subunit
MLGNRLRTKQNQSGLTVNKILLSEQVVYKQEYYCTVTIDRNTFSPVLILSRSGGINIEQAACDDPAALINIPLKYSKGISDEVMQDLRTALARTSKELNLSLL